MVHCHYTPRPFPALTLALIPLVSETVCCACSKASLWKYWRPIFLIGVAIVGLADFVSDILVLCTFAANNNTGACVQFGCHEWETTARGSSMFTLRCAALGVATFQLDSPVTLPPPTQSSFLIHRAALPCLSAGRLYVGVFFVALAFLVQLVFVVVLHRKEPFLVRFFSAFFTFLQMPMLCVCL